ncbi:MAG: hypothetical protein HY461_02645 [Parcubacteria group bacterium]|nr:hypothetical protein [Parcubacteria group bacterium]
MDTTEVCGHVQQDTVDRLNVGSTRFGLIACSRCAHVQHGDKGRGFEFLTDRSIKPVSPGQTLEQAVALAGDEGFRVVTDSTNPNSRVLMHEWRPMETMFILRQTSDGLLVLFPDDDTPWRSRVVHADDVAVGFGVSEFVERLDPEQAPPRINLSDLAAPLNAGNMIVGVERVVRFR